jgi:hypothetical protein
MEKRIAYKISVRVLSTNFVWNICGSYEYLESYGQVTLEMGAKNKVSHFNEYWDCATTFSESSRNLSNDLGIKEGHVVEIQKQASNLSIRYVILIYTVLH